MSVISCFIIAVSPLDFLLLVLFCPRPSPLPSSDAGTSAGEVVRPPLLWLSCSVGGVVPSAPRPRVAQGSKHNLTKRKRPPCFELLGLSRLVRFFTRFFEVCWRRPRPPRNTPHATGFVATDLAQSNVRFALAPPPPSLPLSAGRKWTILYFRVCMYFSSFPEPNQRCDANFQDHKGPAILKLLVDQPHQAHTHARVFCDVRMREKRHQLSAPNAPFPLPPPGPQRQNL